MAVYMTVWNAGRLRDGIAECFCRSIAQFRVYGVELGVLEVAADERLDGADGGRGLLDAAIPGDPRRFCWRPERTDLCDDPGEDGGRIGVVTKIQSSAAG